MAMGIRAKFDGMGAEQFDRLDGEPNARNDLPAGLLFHASGPIDGGWGARAFWESRAQFDSFIAERIAPPPSAVGITTPPEIHEFAVHEYLLGNYGLAGPSPRRPAWGSGDSGGGLAPGVRWLAPT